MELKMVTTMNLENLRRRLRQAPLDSARPLQLRNSRNPE